MVKITTIKQKYYLQITKENIDEQLKELMEGIKGQIDYNGYGNIKITVDITFMTGREAEIYIKAERK